MPIMVLFYEKYTFVYKTLIVFLILISIPYYNLDEWFLLSGKRHAQQLLQ